MAFFFTYAPKEIDNTPSYIRVIVGGCASTISTVLLHPLDLVKVRMQLYPGQINTYQMAMKIWRCEGFNSLFNGLSAGILRQATYTTTRLAVYYKLYELYKRTYGNPTLSSEVLMGIYAGMAGALVGNPSEILLMRLMGDVKPDPCKHCSKKLLYAGVFHAMFKIMWTEGITALWHGSVLTVARSMVVSTIQISGYANVGRFLENNNITGLKLHVIDSIAVSFVSALVTLPVDSIKTVIQVERPRIPQPEVVDYVVKKRGLTQLWSGLMPYFIRMSFHTILASFILENVLDLYYKHKR